MAQERTATPEAYLICRVCGAVNESGSRYCSGCRLRLDRARAVGGEEAEEWLRQQARRTSRRRLRWRVTLLFLVGIPALFSIFTIAEEALERPPPPLPPPASDLSSLAAPGQWLTAGYDLAQTRVVEAQASPLAGEIAWQYRATAPFFAAPAVADGVVYVPTGDGRLVALDEASGSVIWEVGGLGPLSSSPTIAGDWLYLGRRNGELLAFDRREGESRWTATTSGGIYAAPTVSGGEVFIGTVEKVVHSYDALTGQERWRSKVDDVVTASVSVADDIVVVSAEFRAIHVFDVPTGAKVFSYRVPGGVAGAPILREGAVYVLQGGGVLLAIDPTARPPVWEKPVSRVWGQLWWWGLAPEPKRQSGFLWSYRGPGVAETGGLAVAEHTIYFTTQERDKATLRTEEHLVAVDRASRQERWRAPIPGNRQTAPAVVGDVIYVGSGSRLYAVDANNGGVLWAVLLQDEVATDVVATLETVFISDKAGNLYAIR